MTIKGLYRLIGIFILAMSAHIAYTQVDINAMEYFIDTDPGVGMATPVPVTSGATIQESIIVPTNTLTVGFHTLYFRVQDLNSVWSISESRSFYISASRLNAQADVQQVEYFIDTDPGIGAGIALPLTVGTDININTIITTNTLPAGFHTLYVRSRDSDGIWGNVESRSFYVSQSNLTVQANISAVEYYIDTDPGFGAGVPITIAAATTLNIQDTLATNSLSPGHHVVYIRAQDEDGIWSEVESRSFYVDAFTAGGIAGIEYFFDSDPGIGSSPTISIVPAQVNIDSTITFTTAALAAGPHVMGIRLINENGLFGMTEYLNITLCDGATAAILADTICAGSTTMFTDISTNVLAGDIYSWDFDNDGFEDSNTAGDQTYTYPGSGTYFAKLSIDRSGCIGLDSIEVVVEALPDAKAGPDQTLCTDATVLAGSFLGPNEVGVWSVLSGSTLIAMATDSVSAISSISSSSVDLIWTVTNSIAGCSDSDTVSITANLPISANSFTSTVDIGQSVNIDVQSPAAINPGDILTTTITTMPLVGLATILADGSIDYVPDLDAFAQDSLVYRITNQCSNFDENVIVFTVVNAPPAVQNELPSPQAGSTSVNIDLGAFITDPNNNVDLSSLTIITQPISGATASIDASGILSIDYTGITFSGDDMLEIQVCDLSGVCVNQVITIPNVEVGGENPPITVFNGISPDGDGFNDFLEIVNIEFYPNNTVIILSRWGTEITRFQGYNNQNVIFNDSNLPGGIYYYHIIPGIEDVEPVTGHFMLMVE